MSPSTRTMSRLSKRSSNNALMVGSSATMRSPPSPRVLRRFAPYARWTSSLTSSFRTSSSSPLTTTSRRVQTIVAEAAPAHKATTMVAPITMRRAEVTTVTTTMNTPEGSAHSLTVCHLGTTTTTSENPSGSGSTHRALSGAPERGISSTLVFSPNSIRNCSDKLKSTHEIPRPPSATFSTPSVLPLFRNPNGRTSSWTATSTSTPSFRGPSPLNRRNRSSLSSVTPTWKSKT